MRAWPVTLMVFLLAGCFGNGPAGVEPAPGSDDADTVMLYDGFVQPLLALHGPAGDTLFVVEQRGTVQAVQPDGNRSLWADIRDRVGSSGSEQGLLGMAFVPEAEAVLLSYTDTSGDSVLSRFATDSGFDPSSEEVLLTVAQPFGNHNGGHIVYGPDGFLYFGLGDGGLAGDPNANGQNPNTLLGSVLRIDVGATGPYTVPADNPFTEGGGAPEVWLYGLRNPWRFSFDGSGNLWIGDVGQDAWEEISRVRPEQAGANLGWNTWEGTHHFPTGVNSDGTAPGYLFPVAQYPNSGPHCSVTGGMDIGERYFFSDFCSGHVWSMPLDGDLDSHQLHLESGLNVASFGRGPDGTVYLVDLGGTIQRLET